MYGSVQKKLMFRIRTYDYNYAAITALLPFLQIVTVLYHTRILYHTRMVQFCIPYAYGMTICVWYVPYTYNDVLRADSMSRLLACI